MLQRELWVKLTHDTKMELESVVSLTFIFTNPLGRTRKQQQHSVAISGSHVGKKRTYQVICLILLGLQSRLGDKLLIICVCALPPRTGPQF